jgi:putative ABC transport system permease protein
MRKVPTEPVYVNGEKQQNHIHYSTLLHIALNNLFSKKLRSFLTVFGVVIGVSAIFFLLSFGLGVQTLVTEQVIGDQSLKSIDIQSPSSKIVAINEQFVNEVRGYSNVTGVGVQYSFPGITAVKGGEVDSVVYGVDETYQGLSNFVISEGRLLQKDDTKAVVVNASILESLGFKDAKNAIGAEVMVNVPLEKFDAKVKEVKGTYTIVGIVASTSGNEIYLPSTIFDIAGVPSYTQAKIIVNDAANVTNVRLQVEAKGFVTNSLTDTVSEINNIFRFFNLILVGFGSIGMIVAVLGMFNTLTISLLERTQEIGLMMALGARRRDVKRLFTLEAVIISAIGAIIGMLLAYIAGMIVNTYLNLNAQSRGVNEWFNVFEVPLWTVVTVLIATIIVGLLVVFYPARRAGRTNPIEALRRE